ncbi:hypothetical protein ADL35_11590, partial [Streptomyces sp. NRRL WC-3753]
MAATKVTRLWAAFVVVIVKVLAALGFRTPAAVTATATATTAGPVAAPAPVPAEAGDGWAALPAEADTGEPVGERGRWAEDARAFA